MVWAFRRNEIVFSAVFLFLMGALFARASAKRLVRSGRTDFGLVARIRERSQLHAAGLVLAPIFWGRGSILGEGWRFNLVGPLVAHAFAAAIRREAERHIGRGHRLRGSGGRTAEGAAVYLAASFAIQFAVYFVWSQIPGMYHAPRALLWAVLGALTAAVAEFFVPGKISYLAVPLATSAAMWIYVGA
jgi:hypothetical protein